VKSAKRRLVAACALAGLCAAIVAAAMIARPAPAGMVSTTAARGGLSWVYALYVNADDSLDGAWADYSLRRLMHLSGSTHVKVVALIDRRGKAGTTLAEFDARGMTVIARLPEKDLGAAATLRWFIALVHLRYPSEHLALNIWDHGYAWRGFSYDQSSGHQISLSGLAAAVEGARVPIDVLAFDCCNMADAGVVYQAGVTGFVDYVVASEQAVNDAGFPYDAFLNALSADPDRSPSQLAASIVTAFDRSYRRQKAGARAALGAIDARALVAARADLVRWTQEMTAAAVSLHGVVAQAQHGSQFADNGDEVDVGSFLRRLTAQPGIGPRLRDDSLRLLAGLNRATVLVRDGPRVGSLRGLSLWWPTQAGWEAEGDAYSRDVLLARDVGWAGFLSRFEQ
jgi:hypothetical protein